MWSVPQRRNTSAALFFLIIFLKAKLPYGYFKMKFGIGLRDKWKLNLEGDAKNVQGNGLYLWPREDRHLPSHGWGWEQRVRWLQVVTRVMWFMNPVLVLPITATGDNCGDDDEVTCHTLQDLCTNYGMNSCLGETWEWLWGLLAGGETVLENLVTGVNEVDGQLLLNCFLWTTHISSPIDTTA